MNASLRFVVAGLTLLISGPASADELLARESGCFECHGEQSEVASPSFAEIAARYSDNADARATLIETVKRGGKGNWAEVAGGAPMPPYSPRLSDAQIAQLIDWILGG